MVVGLELEEDGGQRHMRHPVNGQGLQKDMVLKYEDQTLAVYPVPLLHICGPIRFVRTA